MSNKGIRAKLGHEPVRAMGLLFGGFLYAIGANYFVVPAGLYAGGIMGLCQILRTIIVENLGFRLENVDLAGILYYAVNLPILLIAWRKIDRRFVARTLITVSSMSMFMAFLPPMDILHGDTLGMCLVGGLCCGIGCGITLLSGGTSGGMDVVGVMMMKSGTHISVGQVNLGTNLLLYGLCALMFDLPTAIYSIIYAAVCAVGVDKIHSQNINAEVTIISKIDTHDMEQEILTGLTRGVTKLKGSGGYTDQEANVLIVVLSKFEINHLRRIINRHDPHAFVITKYNAVIYGNYLKKL